MVQIHLSRPIRRTKITIYESNKDRQKQADIAAKLEAAWNVTCLSTPTLSSVDFILYNEQKEAKALVEVKDRDIFKDKYSTFFISENKINHALTISDSLKLPLLLVVQWKDKLGWKKIVSTEGYEIKIGGRKDRGSANDIERLVHINTDEFRVI